MVIFHDKLRKIKQKRKIGLTMPKTRLHKMDRDCLHRYATEKQIDTQSNLEVI